MSEKYVVRYAIFRRKGGGNVYDAVGRDGGSRRRGFPSKPPPPYRAPAETRIEVPSYAEARKLVRELHLEHGPERVAVTVERIAPAKPPRPRQTSLADLGDWPRELPARWRLTQ